MRVLRTSFLFFFAVLLAVNYHTSFAAPAAASKVEEEVANKVIKKLLPGILGDGPIGKAVQKMMPELIKTGQASKFLKALLPNIAGGSTQASSLAKTVGGPLLAAVTGAEASAATKAVKKAGKSSKKAKKSSEKVTPEETK